MKKIAVLILIASLILTVISGCDKTKPVIGNEPVGVSNISDKKEGTLKLAYSKADMLDPFTSSMSANIQIMGLIYDGLYKLNKNYEPVPVIAKSSIVSGTTVNVTLGSAVFSDGTPITSSDVVYSFEQARYSPNYSTRLQNFLQASVSSSNMLVFTLESADPYALSCLTFPIVKNGSEGELPVGSGRYVPQISGESTYLVVNTKRSDFNPAIKTIMLVPVRDSNSIESSLEIGNTGFYYNDLGSGSYLRINAKTVDMGINNFVYLGFNSESFVFSDVNIRNAVNLAINRNEIANNAFQGHARATYTPFNPDWYALSSKDLVISMDLPKAEEYIGLSELDIASKEISLLVNKDNQFKLETAELIKGYLEKIGFKVNLKAYSAEYYAEAVKLGSYDIYIGEVRLSPNMDLFPIFGGDVSYGIDPLCPSASRYNQYLNGKCELMDFVNTFNEDLPLIPLCYRNAAASYTNSMQGDFNSCDGDVFFNIEEWSFK